MKIVTGTGTQTISVLFYDADVFVDDSYPL